MDELRLGVTPLGRSQGDLAAWLRNWQLGQVVRAQVVDASSPGSVLLRIANRQVAASTGIFLQQGAWLNLEVTGLNPLPTLRVLESATRNNEAAGPLERQAQLLLARQGTVQGPLLTLLGSSDTVNLLSLLGVRGGELESTLNRLLRPGIPNSTEALKQALAQSGLFFESDLARTGSPPANNADLKALLFQLLARVIDARARVAQSPVNDLPQVAAQAVQNSQTAALASLLPSLQVELEGALANMSLQQLSLSQLRQPDAWIWVFHVPFRLREQLQFLSVTLRQETAADGSEAVEREWKALLVLDLPQLGNLEIEVFLRGSRVSAVFYSPQAQVVALLESALPTLEACLGATKFDVGVLRAHFGRRAVGSDDATWGSGFTQRA